VSSDAFFAITISSLAIYMAVNAMWTKEFYRLQSGGKRLLVHAMGCAVAACLGIVALLVVDASFYFGASYLFMPLLYLGLLLSASRITRRLHGRQLLVAANVNLEQERMRGAKFSDYAFFLAVHVVPMIVPAFVFETILGVGV
jgi:hypothetical protein